VDATSPCTTKTLTPPRDREVCMAICSRRGICFSIATSWQSGCTRETTAPGGSLEKSPCQSRSKVFAPQSQAPAPTFCVRRTNRCSNGDCLARNFRRKLQDFRSVALQRSQRRRLLLRAARVSIRSSCCGERRRQWRLDENKIRIRMNEATGEIKDVNVDAKAELAPRKKLER